MLTKRNASSVWTWAGRLAIALVARRMVALTILANRALAARRARGIRAGERYRRYADREERRERFQRYADREFARERLSRAA